MVIVLQKLGVANYFYNLRTDNEGSSEEYISNQGLAVLTEHRKINKTKTSFIFSRAARAIKVRSYLLYGTLFGIVKIRSMRA